MDPITIGILAFLFLMALILVGIPIGFAMLTTASLGYMATGRPSFAETQLSLTFVNQGQNFILVAVPLYFLMGQLVQRTNIAQDLYECVYRWLGRLPGGIAISTVVACAGFGAVSGGAVTAIATIGPMAIPAMRKYKYDDALATGSIAAAGTLGILIPPSLVMVGYGILTETSIGALFIAGIVPGLLMTLAYAVTIAVRCRLNPSLGPLGERFELREKIASLSKVLPILLTFVIVVGGIYAGAFTPTEAAGIGVAALLVISLVMRRMSWRVLGASLLQSAQTSAMIFIILVGGYMMGKFIATTGLSQMIVDAILAGNFPPLVIILMITVAFIALGMVLDVWGMMILTVPFTLPIIIQLGYSPVWYGVYAVIMSELALITPPVGINVYVLAKVAPDVPLMKIFRGVAPFFIATLALVALIVFFPQIVMWLPGSAGMQ
ncbi:MAG: TRAP transporter large permease [Pseudomonadota bacterium]